jgi:hypothetical protein
LISFTFFIAFSRKFSRYGYTTDGKLIELDAQDFFQTIEDIKKFSSSLQEQINEILAE